MRSGLSARWSGGATTPTLTEVSLRVPGVRTSGKHQVAEASRSLRNLDESGALAPGRGITWRCRRTNTSLATLGRLFAAERQVVRRSQSRMEKQVRMFRKTFVTFLIVGGILLGLSQVNVRLGAQASAPLSKVNGIVKDSHDAVVGGAVIWFETKIDRKKFRQKAESNRNGLFEVELPAGSYQVTVKFSGFYNFKREGLIVESAKPLTFDIVLKENPRKIPAITE